MKKRMLFYFVLFFSCYASAQQEIKMTTSEYNKEKEAILNTIINSVQFDSINSIYSGSSSFFVFAENEILHKGIPIMLTYKNQRIEIIDCSQTKENCYWVGDFFLNSCIEDLKEARAQIAFVRKNEEDILFGIILEKCKKWKIKSFTLID
jgi:hypothetical protein